MNLKTTATLFSTWTLAFFLGACAPNPENQGDGTSQGADPDSSENPEAAAALSVEEVDAAAAAKMIEKNSEVVVLDVRTPEEFGEGHIAGAVNIDFKAAGFREEVAKLDKSKSYLVHCRSGARSSQSLEVFKELGFSEIHHMGGGFNEWSAAGKLVATE